MPKSKKKKNVQEKKISFTEKIKIVKSKKKKKENSLPEKIESKKKKVKKNVQEKEISLAEKIA